MTSPHAPFLDDPEVDHTMTWRTPPAFRGCANPEKAQFLYGHGLDYTNAVIMANHEWQLLTEIQQLREQVTC